MHASHDSESRTSIRSWADILHLASRLTRPAGHPLMLEGSALTDFYYIEKGHLLISHASQNGRERYIISLNEGSVFNVASALTGFDNPDTQYLCKEDTVLWRFPGRLLRSCDFIRSYPELIVEIMQAMACRSLQMHASLSYTGSGTALTQLARWIQHNIDDHDSTELSPNISQQELAARLGIHRATLVRCIHTLKERHIVGKFTRHSLIVLDKEALRLLAEQ